MFDDCGLEKLIKRGKPITLVLGAGVSSCRGLPLWFDLLRRAWEPVMKFDPYSAEMDLLDRSKQACLQAGLPAAFIKRLDVRRHPFELQFAFETIYARLRWSATRARLEQELKIRVKTKGESGHKLSNEELAAEYFAALLRKILYRGQPRRAKAKRGATDTLSLIAAAAKRSARAASGDRRLGRILTFNVDDLLEQLVNAGKRKLRPSAFPVTRVNDLNRGSSQGSIEIVHLHGFVPQHPSDYPFMATGGGKISDIRMPVESLVFTDEQYWQTVGNPGGFASRIFAQALDGTCVFVGLSMTDLNIIRWLAQYSIEASRGFRIMTSSWKDQDEAVFHLSEDLLRHFWIVEEGPQWAESTRKADQIGSGVLREILRERGVDLIQIPSWKSQEFSNWWTRCFIS